MSTSFNPNQMYPLVRSNRFNYKYYGKLSLITELGTYLNSPTLNLGALFNSPNEFITSIKMFPFDLSKLDFVASGTENIRLGTEDTGISAKSFSLPKPSVYMGSYHFNEYYHSFLDYNTFTKINVFLPYIGFESLDPNEVMNKTVRFDYAIDMDSGEVTCAISIQTDTEDYVIKTRSGKIAIDIPLGSTNAREISKNFVNSMIGIVGGTIAMPFSKGFGVAMGVGMTTKGTKDMYNAFQYHYNRSGNPINGFNNLPLPQSIYIIIERNKIKYNPVYTKGRPFNQVASLNEVHGYCEVDRFLKNFALNYGTKDELDEVKQLLRTGVYLP